MPEHSETTPIRFIRGSTERYTRLDLAANGLTIVAEFVASLRPRRVTTTATTTTRPEALAVWRAQVTKVATL